jgi:GNAT superfamily N-acetyltransferase
MPDPRIVSYSLQQLIDDPDALAGYDDPGGYLSESGPRWVEFLRGNPRRAPDDLVIVLTVVADRIVGSLRSIPVALRIGGQTIRSVALRAFFLDAEWRGGGAGGMMLLRVLSTTRSVIAAGGPRPETIALYLRAGFTTIGPLSRQVYFNSTRPLIATAFRAVPLVSGISVALDPFVHMYYRARSRQRESGVTFTRVDQFSVDLDRVLASRSDDHMVRESSDLNWVLTYSRGLSAYEMWDGDALSGYCLIRTEDRAATPIPFPLPPMRVTSVLDFHVADPQPRVLSQLVRHAVQCSKADGAEVLEIQTNRPDLLRCLKNAGFVGAGGFKVLLKTPPTVPADPGRWRMAAAQGDVFFSALSVGRSHAPETPAAP